MNRKTPTLIAILHVPVTRESLREGYFHFIYYCPHLAIFMIIFVISLLIVLTAISHYFRWLLAHAFMKITQFCSLFLLFYATRGYTDKLNVVNRVMLIALDRVLPRVPN